MTTHTGSSPVGSDAHRPGTESVRSGIEPFHVMDMMRAAAVRARVYGDLVSMTAGQPGSPAPAPVLAAAHHALDTHVLGYTETFGIAPLRAAIATYHTERHGIVVDADDVVVTTGSSGGFQLIFMAAFDVGDTVAVARPGYPAYRNTLQALGCRVIELDCGAADRYQPTVAMLERLPEPPAGLIIASPANPTGTIIEPTVLRDIARWCAKHGTLLISDEIYHGIEFGTGPDTSSAWQTSRESVVVGSVSKYFSMTGWRLGWLLAPEYLREPLQRLAGNLTICPPAISQYAAIHAFDRASIEELDGHVHRYGVNRRILLDGLASLGITDIAPADGSFYAYADIGHLTDNTTRWCHEVLDRIGVAIAPGIDFDTEHGLRTVRLSFAGVPADIDEGLARLGQYLRP